MDKFKEIRPIALGIVKRNNKILVNKFSDSNKNEVFYRCLGGGIEFLEKGEDALKREFKEELDLDVKVGNFLGIVENIFEYKGKNAHELILFYKVDIKEDDYREIYKVIDDADETEAVWMDIEAFKEKKYILYPLQILNMI